MSPKKETISPEKYYKLVQDQSELLVKMEQINALASALCSMVSYASDTKWEIIADMIKGLSA